MARKPSSKPFAGKPRGLVVVVEKERMRGGDGHRLGGRPHAADSRRDLGRDPMKGGLAKRDSTKGA